jgi:AGZA family xanthine/uracil permease-like MFS transporter
MKNFLEKSFKLSENKTTIRTEILAGLTTFLTMAYIIIVDPQILSTTGMPVNAVLFATIAVSAVSSVFFGFYANLPIALSVGMGLNAFFAFTLCGSMGVSWQTGLAAVFISGIIFVILSLTGVREMIINAIPQNLKYSIAIGIGFFLALIGFKSVGFIISDAATVVSFGGMTLTAVLFFAALIFTILLEIKKVRGAFVIGIIVTSAVAWILSQFLPKETMGASYIQLPESILSLPQFDTVLALDLKSALTVGMIMPVFTFLFTSLFDGISTLVGVCEAAGLNDEKGNPKNIKKALLVDSLSGVFAGLAGNSTGTAYVESAAGVQQGGRTGLTAVVVGLLFIPFMFFGNLVGVIPSVATAPVLVIIGLFMLQPVKKIDWMNYEEAIPAFLAMFLIPFTYSITQGIVWGFLSYTLIKVCLGKFKDIHPMLYIIDVLAIVALISV